MKSRWIRLIALLALLATLARPARATGLLPPASPPLQTGVHGLEVVSAPGVSGIVAAAQAKQGPGVADNGGPATYLVLLSDPPLATYSGEVAGLAATRPDLQGQDRLDLASSASRQYLSHLQSRQDAFLGAAEQSLGRSLKVRHRYQLALNGLAVEVTAQEAGLLAAQPGVARVEPDTAMRLSTDAGPEWIGAQGIWDSSATGGLPGTLGEGVVIGVIDSGINLDHPSFADVGGDGYNHTNPLGAGVYKGWCASHPGCNDKLIGAWDYADASWPSETDGPEDNNGHGSHTASTAAGNIISATLTAPTTVINGTISGVAPHANLIAYDVCGPTGFCNTSDVVAAVNQAISDGVDVLNESIGIGGDPFTGSKQQAYLSAYTAGILVARSAGNDGPLAGSVGPEPPWVISSAASSHDRTFSNSLTSLTSSGPSLPDIAGSSLTSGYGPAAIVHGRDFDGLPTSHPDDGQCLTPFPANTWTSGEIVVCDRGTISRVGKGNNVQVGGAGGFVLANTVLEGESLSVDAHSLPAVHIGYTDALALAAWMGANSNTRARISGSTRASSPSAGDVMADFSSRGPGQIDIIKPDVTSPGVSIWAAVNTTNPTDPPEFGFLSGTSMSSPHTAGAAALVKALHPSWGPGYIRSALMTTAQDAGVRKEDGFTPAGPFDRGAGRLDLSQAGQAGLVLGETSGNFNTANPASGGDPRTLNLASMQDSACYLVCTWTRSVTNPSSGATRTWRAAYQGAGSATITPDTLTLGPGQSKSFSLSLDLQGLPSNQWYTGSLVWTETSGGAPAARMPVAARPVTSTDDNALTKTVDRTGSPAGTQLTYTIALRNTGTTTRDYSLSDPIPPGAVFSPGSLTGGLGYDSGSNTLTWNGSLDPLDLAVTPGAAPFGYQSLAGMGITPVGCPSDCDDGGFIISALDITYFGVHYSDAIWSVNGTLEIGSGSLSSSGSSNTPLPAADTINNLLAPWWTDLDLSAGGNWYLATLTDGVHDYDVFEWENVPRYNDLSSRATFQVWLQRGSDQIWFTYKPGGPTGNTGTATVGAENSDGTIGDQVYYNGAGSVPDGTQELLLVLSSQAAFSFQVLVVSPGRDIFNEVQVTEGPSTTFKAWALTEVKTQFLPMAMKD